ncbi:MAG: hypothetical protein AB7D57_10910 [Desulfovibrionaceae bacterium]
MPDQSHQRLGDDQLVHGLPKHMTAVAQNDAGAGEKQYWEYVPKPEACEKCQAMKGRLFAERPGPVHPNCNCEVRQTKRKQIDLYGTLAGFEAHEFLRFDAGQVVTLTIINSTLNWAGAYIFVDGRKEADTQWMWIGESQSFTFSKFGEPPISWEIRLVCRAGNNTTLLYHVHGELPQ